MSRQPSSSGPGFWERFAMTSPHEKLWLVGHLGYLLVITGLSSGPKPLEGPWQLEVAVGLSIVLASGYTLSAGWLESKHITRFWRQQAQLMLLLAAARAFWIMLLFVGRPTHGIFLWQSLLGNTVLLPWLAWRLNTRVFEYRWKFNLDEITRDQQGHYRVIDPNAPSSWAVFYYPLLAGLEPAFWLFLNRSLSWQVQP